MVALNRIYTRTGDDGTSGLVTGERRSKADLRFECIGTIDEVNALIGVARCDLFEEPVVDAMLGRIQNDLFDLGADLATPEETLKEGRDALRVVEREVERIEGDIDELNADLSPLRSFVLPGGSRAAASLHVARTVARRAERGMVALAERERVNPSALRYINRLSDFLFVAARFVNDRGTGDVLWVPGQNR
ncbi:MAG: cob(I)yrinic acid a,c-diamide adenosyltransferase [Bosea sp.]|nr:cob(I)yrinic acid a,c-diamide adenosyltransferase [Bosea sp. (in: a-proteobacteria)]